MSRFKFRVETAGNLFWKNFLWRPPSWQINFEIGTRQIGNHFSLNLVRGINSPPQKKHHFYPENPSALSSDSQRNASAFLNDDESMFHLGPAFLDLTISTCGWNKNGPCEVKHLGGWLSIIFKGPKRCFFWGQIANVKPPPKLQVFPRVVSRPWRKQPNSFLVGGFSPTHLKNMLVKMGSSSPRFGMNIPKMFELPTT